MLNFSMPHQWFNHKDLVNFDLNCSHLKKHAVAYHQYATENMICFSHVPKTGGTSLEHILSKNFAMSEVIHINAPDLNKQPELLQLKKNPPQLICGHHPMHGLLYQVLPNKPVFHITQLRNPVDRVLSYYNYVVGKQDHPMHGHAINKSITEFIQSEPSPELANGQSKRFSGYLHHGDVDNETLFTMAKDTLNQCFSLVLTTCLFDEGLLLLKKHLGLSDIYYQHSNVSKKFISRQQLSSSELALIETINQADMKLFQWAKSNCQKLISEELSTVELDDYQHKLQTWRTLIDS